jgi:hypothetical protein
MRREAGGHENFFIAKIRDSESAPAAFGGSRRAAMKVRARCALSLMLTKKPAAQALPAISTIERDGSSRVVGIAMPTFSGLADERARRTAASSRQHFLKRDAVFFNVLVYSGCRAFRFPSARSD